MSSTKDFGMYLDEYGDIKDKTAGFDGQEANEAKNKLCSAALKVGVGVGDLDALGIGEGVRDSAFLKSKDITFVKLFFFPIKSIFFTGAYGTSLTPFGITQYAFFWVTVIESLIRTPDSTAQRSDATCEHDSPSPAIQSQ